MAILVYAIQVINWKVTPVLKLNKVRYFLVYTSRYCILAFKETLFVKKLVIVTQSYLFIIYYSYVNYNYRTQFIKDTIASTIIIDKLCYIN